MLKDSGKHLPNHSLDGGCFDYEGTGVHQSYFMQSVSLKENRRVFGS